MSINRTAILKALRRSAAVVLLGIPALGAFATLGDGKEKSPKNYSLLTNKNLSARFSLRSNYNYRGSEVINLNRENKYIDLNTVLTYQKGNTTYVVPLKKKIYITTGNAGFTITH
jgi:hypothetical protein